MQELCSANIVSCLADRTLFMFEMNIVRYYPIAGLIFLVFWIWKKDYFHKFRIQEKFPKLDRIIFEIKHSFVTLVMFTLVGVGFMVLRVYDILPKNVYRDPSLHGGWPYMILSFVMVTVWQETWFYWMHRLVHHKKIYPIVHSVHHRSINPSPLAAYNFHWMEGILEAIYLPIFVVFVPFEYHLLLFHTFVVMILNVWWHLGYEFFPKGWASHPIFKWINTSTHHNLHHQKFHGNYSLYFNFWDRIMGTNFPFYESYYDEVVENRKSRAPVSDGAAMNGLESVKG